MDILIQIKVIMGQFGLKDATKNKSIIMNKKTPIIVGGTGLYLEFVNGGISHVEIFLKKLRVKLKNCLKKKVKRNV